MAHQRAMTFSFFRSAYPWLIVFCGMLFYCYNYFLRVSPSVMQNELAESFHITATQFGALAAFYYHAYTPMQIPAGLLYDKFGVRLVLSTACLIAALGLNVFISADDYTLASIGRFMIGLGGAFAYIGTLKLASLWLPANRFATVAGLATAIGMTSGALAQKHLSAVIEHIGYQKALHTAVIIGIILSFLLVTFIRSRPAAKTTQDLQEAAPMGIDQLWKALRHIFTNRQMWLIGIIGCLLYLPSSVFLDTWGVSYLKTAYHISSYQAVTISNYTFYGWIISGPIIGAFSDKIKRRKLLLTCMGFFAALMLSIVFYVPGLNVAHLNVIFFLVGFCCGSHSLCFALGKENNPIQIAGTAVAVTNMLIMAGGNIFQPFVGKLLDLHSAAPVDATVLHTYTASDYTFALSVIPLGVALGIFLSFFLKETRCESQATEEEERLFKPVSLPGNA